MRGAWGVPVAKRGKARHYLHMAKGSKKTLGASEVRKLAASALMNTPKVLGVTKDGVRILKPKSGATHFSAKEIRDAIATVRAAKRAG